MGEKEEYKKFDFRHVESISTHFAIICMAYVRDGYPLYYEETGAKLIETRELLENINITNDSFSVQTISGGHIYDNSI